MNTLDRLIGWVSPTAGLARMRARTVLTHLDTATRAYDGARVGRRGNGRSLSTSANAEIGPAGTRLRNRARDLVRNNGHAARVVDIVTSNLVGTGIRPVSKTGVRSLDRRVNDLFQRFADTCDADGQLDYYGLQALSVRSMTESGEVLQRFRPRRVEDGLPVPLQIQVLEADHLDSSRHGENVDGARAILGVAFDGIGRRSGYWLYRDHPGEMTVGSLSSVRVPADEVLHLYRKLRPGQVRGVTPFAPVMNVARDIADLNEAALAQANVAACFGGFVTLQDGDRVPLGPERKDEDGNRVQSFEPGMLTYLKPGESISFAQPGSFGAYDPFLVQNLMTFAAGAGVTYDQVTGDLRQANYSSLRAGKIEFRRLVEQMQWHTLIPMWCAPTWRRFIDTAILSGALPRRAAGYPVEWIVPAYEPIDPVKDLQADILAVRSGRMTWAQFVSAWGYDPDEQLEEIMRINGLLDAGGVVLDIDPRRTAQAGSVQQVPAASDPAPANAADPAAL